MGQLPQSKTSSYRIKAAERQIKALELRKAGATLRQIGEALDCSEQRAHQIICGRLKKINDVRAGLTEDVRQLEIERLDAMFLGLWSRAREGDEKAVRAAVLIMERRAKLLGIDAPTRTEVSGADGGPVFIALDRGADGGRNGHS